MDPDRPCWPPSIITGDNVETLTDTETVSATSSFFVPEFCFPSTTTVYVTVTAGQAGAATSTSEVKGKKQDKEVAHQEYHNGKSKAHPGSGQSEDSGEAGSKHGSEVKGTHGNVSDAHEYEHDSNEGNGGGSASSTGSSGSQHDKSRYNGDEQGGTGQSGSEHNGSGQHNGDSGQEVSSGQDTRHGTSSDHGSSGHGSHNGGSSGSSDHGSDLESGSHGVHGYGNRTHMGSHGRGHGSGSSHMHTGSNNSPSQAPSGASFSPYSGSAHGSGTSTTSAAAGMGFQRSSHSTNIHAGRRSSSHDSPPATDTHPSGTASISHHGTGILSHAPPSGTGAHASGSGTSTVHQPSSGHHNTQALRPPIPPTRPAASLPLAGFPLETALASLNLAPRPHERHQDLQVQNQFSQVRVMPDLGASSHVVQTSHLALLATARQRHQARNLLLLMARRRALVDFRALLLMVRRQGVVLVPLTKQARTRVLHRTRQAPAHLPNLRHAAPRTLVSSVPILAILSRISGVLVRRASWCGTPSPPLHPILYTTSTQSPVPISVLALIFIVLQP